MQNEKCVLRSPKNQKVTSYRDFQKNVVTILLRDGKQINIDRRSKREVADEILNQAVLLKRQQGERSISKPLTPTVLERS